MIPDRVATVVPPALVGIAQVRFDMALFATRVRFVADVADDAAHRIRPDQGALGTAQHLQAL